MSNDWTPSHVNRFKNAKIQKLSPWAKLLFEYLYSNQATTRSGIYPLDLDQAALDLGLSVDLLRPLLEEIATAHEVLKPAGRRKPLILYDGSVVFLVGQWKHACNHGPNHMNGVCLEFTRSHTLPYWPIFFKLYPEVARHGREHQRFAAREAFIRLYSELEDAPRLVPANPYAAPDFASAEALRESVLEALPGSVREALPEALPGKPSEGLTLRGEEREDVGTTPLSSPPPPQHETRAAPAAEDLTKLAGVLARIARIANIFELNNWERKHEEELDRNFPAADDRATIEKALVALRSRFEPPPPEEGDRPDYEIVDEGGQAVAILAPEDDLDELLDEDDLDSLLDGEDLDTPDPRQGPATLEGDTPPPAELERPSRARSTAPASIQAKFDAAAGKATPEEIAKAGPGSDPQPPPISQKKAELLERMKQLQREEEGGPPAPRPAPASNGIRARIANLEDGLITDEKELRQLRQDLIAARIEKQITQEELEPCIRLLADLIPEGGDA